MKKYNVNIKLIITIMEICITSLFLFTACDDNNSNNGSNNTDTGSNDVGTVTEGNKITDYVLPENLVITLMIADTKIYNPGSPWYPKTAKIGNDWQIIEYDRDAVNKNEQKTYFFKYISDDSYMQFLYDYKTLSWIEQGKVNFDGMIKTSPVNFAFLYKKPDSQITTIKEIETIYDTDPTSIENLIPAISYEYNDVLEYQIIVDKSYQNIKLSEVCRHGATVNTSNKAYEYSKSIDNWNSSYMTQRYYKNMP